jgi:hypothetical protein
MENDLEIFNLIKRATSDFLSHGKGKRTPENVENRGSILLPRGLLTAEAQDGVMPVICVVSKEKYSRLETEPDYK